MNPLPWIASIGAVTAEATAIHDETTVPSARARLAIGTRRGLLSSHRPLTGEPTLYAATRSGLRACGMSALAPCRVTPACGRHLVVCAEVAARLARAYPDFRVMGERELRLRERAPGRRLGSAVLASGVHGEVLHRPDLVLWPPGAASAQDGSSRRATSGAIAVEVELTRKAPQRLAAICKAWARSRQLMGVVYVVTPPVERPVKRAIQAAQADAVITVVSLDLLRSL